MPRVVFMGTPEFAVPSLQALISAADIEVVGVVTQPDRPAGRGQKIKVSPVKALAEAHNLPLYQPEKLRGDDAVTQLTAWQPDIYVVVAYGQILRKNILAIPPRGSVNVHGSILPRWRGASPIQAVIRAGDAESGLTIMLMDEGMDTGPMLYKASITLAPDETAQTLHDKLAEISGETLLTGLRGYFGGTLQLEAQDDELATYATMIKKTDGDIQWTHSALEIDRLVRAFTPWPGAYTYWDNTMLKVKAGQPLTNAPADLKSGEVRLNTDLAPLIIGTAEGCYAPSQLQLEGRKALDITDFVNVMGQIDGAILHSAPED